MIFGIFDEFFSYFVPFNKDNANANLPEHVCRLHAKLEMPARIIY